MNLKGCILVTASVCVHAGGIVICKGQQCSVTMENVNFKHCTLAVIEGASATVEGSAFLASTTEGVGICAFVHGAGSNLSASDSTFRGGLQCIAVHAGGAFAGDGVVCSRAEVMGIEAKDEETIVMLQNSCKITDIDPHKQHCSYEDFYSKGIFVHQGATIKVSDCIITQCVRGMHVSNGKAAAEGVTTKGSTDEGFRVENEGTLVLDGCRSEGDFQGCRVATSVAFTATNVQVIGSRQDGFYFKLSEGVRIHLENCCAEKCGFNGVVLCCPYHGRSSVVPHPQAIQKMFSMKGGRVAGNGKCGVYAWSGGEGLIEGVDSSENGECGFKAENFGSILELRNCTSSETAPYVRADWGRILLEGCTPQR
jgi:hypothetical protein